MPLGGKSEHILRPARVSTVAASFAIALLLNFLPWTDLRVVPDFVALVLTFWCVRQPRLVGLGVAWTVGLLVDAGNGVLLGQHALAYSVLAFLSIWLWRRILWFGPMLQAAHVALMLAAAQTLVLVVRIAAGGFFPGWAIYVSPLAGALLWPMVSWLLILPQRRLEREHVICARAPSSPWPNCVTTSASWRSFTCASGSPAYWCSSASACSRHVSSSCR